MEELAKDKKNKRNQHKYPTLVREVNSRVRQEYMDYDYVNQLSDGEKQWLDDFNKEYYCANVGRQADEGKDNRFIKGRDQVKERTDANNKRNNDLYGNIRNKVGATKLLNYDDAIGIIDDMSSNRDPDQMEDALIEFLDSTKELGKPSSDPDDDPDNS